MSAKRPHPDVFPVIVKDGSAVVKIYRDQNRSGEYFRVVFYLSGKRNRLHFSTLAEARKEAKEKASQLSRGDLDATRLTGQDRLIYGRALNAIRPTGVSLDIATAEYAEANKRLAGQSLLEAVNFYLRHRANGTTGQIVADAVEEFRQAKKAAGRSDAYLKEIKYRLGGFAKAFNLEVRELVAQDVADYLERLNLHPRTYNNQLSMLRTFLRFCQVRGWLSKHENLLSSAERRSRKQSEIEIFTPGELRKILAVATPHVATCFALQAFSGIRTAELLRLTWHDLERRPGYIEITAQQAKTGARRLIPIASNLAAWLRAAPHNGNRLWNRSSNRYVVAQALAASNAGIAWRKNALRHSFISYRLALRQDVAAVSLEAGNSARVVFTNYRELCAEAEAYDWFSIMPPDAPANIVQIPGVCSA
jgi:integrase